MTIQPDYLTQLKKLSLIIEKRITSSFVGERKSVFKGRGIIPESFRAYAYGDDFKDIDWRLFARTDKLNIKTFEEEKSLTTFILLDYSGSMNFGKTIKKSEYGAMLAIGFAYLAMRKNEKFVLSTFAEELELYRPRRGLSHLASMVHYLNEKKVEGKTEFFRDITKHKRMVKSRSLIVIISDFLYDIEEIKNALLRYRGHEIVVIQVLDPLERKLRLEGDFQFQDVETGGVLRTFVGPFLRKTYEDKLSAHNAALQYICDQVHATFYTVTTDQDIFEVFFRILRR
ncbi:MAG: DUF58 domain-containing protein [Candidatus Woesearchaeota archaeon]